MRIQPLPACCPLGVGQRTGDGLNQSGTLGRWGSTDQPGQIFAQLRDDPRCWWIPGIEHIGIDNRISARQIVEMLTNRRKECTAMKARRGAIKVKGQ